LKPSRVKRTRKREREREGGREGGGERERERERGKFVDVYQESKKRWTPVPEGLLELLPAFV